MTDGLEQALLVKNDRKQAYDIGVKETKRLDICERLSIEKKQLDQASKRMEMEERVEMRKLALEEQKIALQKSQMGPVGNLFNIPIEGMEDINFDN